MQAYDTHIALSRIDRIIKRPIDLEEDRSQEITAIVLDLARHAQHTGDLGPMSQGLDRLTAYQTRRMEATHSEAA